MTDAEMFEAFTKAIEADRYDRTTRLVFADWLYQMGRDDEAKWQANWTPERQEGEDWLREIAAACRYRFEVFMKQMNEGNFVEDYDCDDELCGDAAHARTLMSAALHSGELKKNLEKYEGKAIKESDMPESFGCSC
jgi:uncharacterized protein (TIGR02996 family)